MMLPRTFAFLISVLLLGTVVSVEAAPLTEADCTPKEMTGNFVGQRYQGDAPYCYSFVAADLMGEALGLRPPYQLSALAFGTEFISLKRHDAEEANAKIVYEQESGKTSAELFSPSKGLTFHSEVFKSQDAAPSLIPLSIASDPLVPTPHYGIVSNRDLYRFDDKSGMDVSKRDGGYADLLLAHMLSQPKFCTESDLPSEEFKNRITTNNPNYFMKKLMALGNEKEVARLLEKKVKESCPSDSSCPIAAGPNIDQAKAIHAVIQDQLALSMRENAKAKCTIDNPHADLEIHNYKNKHIDVDSMVGKMMSVLNSNRPFAVEFDPCKITECGKNNKVENHISIIEGRQWDSKSKSCMVKLRNTWGYTCQKTLVGSCDKGTYLVPIDSMAVDTSNLIWIDKK